MLEQASVLARTFLPNSNWAATAVQKKQQKTLTLPSGNNILPFRDVIHFGAGPSTLSLGPIGDYRERTQSSVFEVNVGGKKRFVLANVELTSHNKAETDNLKMVRLSNGTIQVKDKKTERLFATIKHASNLNAPIEVYQGKLCNVVIVSSPVGPNRYFLLPGASMKMNGAEIDVAPAANPYQFMTLPVLAPNRKPSDQLHSDAVVLLLGGGIGTRIHPLTWPDYMGIAKPALPIHGNYSILGFLMKNLHEQGFREFAVHTAYMPDSVMDGVRYAREQANKSDPCNPITNFEYRDLRPSGTMGGLYQMLQETYSKYEKISASNLKDHTIVVQGDAVMNVRLDDLLETHKGNQALVTIGAMQRPKSEAVNTFGVISTDVASGSGPIANFVEKPKTLDKLNSDLVTALRGKDPDVELDDVEKGDSCLVNTGIYVIAPQARPLIKECYDETLKVEQAKARAKGAPEPNEVPEFDFAKHFFPWLLEKFTPDYEGKVYQWPRTQQRQLPEGVQNLLWAETVQGYWNDVGTIDEYYKTISDIQNGRLGFATEPIDPGKQDGVVRDPNTGVVYWPGTMDEAKKDGAEVKGHAIVARPFLPEKTKASFR